MKYIRSINEKKPKGAPEFHHSDAPDANGRFKELGIKDLAAWLIKTRKGDVKKISGSLTQQVVFNRNEDPEYAEKMEKVRKEVYKQLDRQDLIDAMDESVVNEADSYDDYPAAAKKAAQQAIDWKEKYGRDEVSAGTPVGWARAHQLAKGEKLSVDTIKRMAAFNRHRKNSSIAPEHKDEPWKDNGYVAWLIWGGDAGVDWAIEKSKELDKMEESKSLKHIQTLNEFKQVNEGYWSNYEYKKWTEKNGKIRWPKWCKPLMKEIIQGGFMDPVYDAEHNYIYLMWNRLSDDEKFDSDKRKKALGKKPAKLVSDHYNDVTGYTAFFFEGAMIALELSKQVDDQLADMKMPEPAYYVAKEYFKNHGMNYNRSRIFNATVDKLDAWYKANRIQTL